MSVLTSFGLIIYGDNTGLLRWIDVHERRHKRYAFLGLSPGGDLQGPINGDWMLRHAARHARLGQLTTQDLAALMLPRIWKNDVELSDWHLIHDRVHSAIDRSIGHGG